MPLPHEIHVGPTQSFPVFQKELDEGLGYYRRGAEIVVDSRLTNAEQHAILLHEMIHVASEKIAHAGLSPEPSESYVTNLAGTLFSMLALSGLWNGVTPEEADVFINTPEPEYATPDPATDIEVNFEDIVTFVQQQAQQDGFAITDEQIKYVFDGETAYYEHIGLIPPIESGAES